MPKSMAWNEEMKLGRGEGRLKNHLSFLLPSRDWSAGKKKNHFLVSPRAPRDALESVVALCGGSCSSHTLLEGFLSTHMHTLMHDLKRECCNEMFRKNQISRLLP